MIEVVCREHIEQLLEAPIIKEPPWALISIYTVPELRLIRYPEEKKLFEMGCVKTLSLCFRDIIPSEPGSDVGLFDEAHAYRIKDFIDSLHGIEKIVVHCDAGISRSGAVGLWACRYLGQDESVFRANNPQINPNTHVYDTLYVISGMKASYQDFWDSLYFPK
jgi:predicted protein tyrosine phosphatase